MYISTDLQRYLTNLFKISLDNCMIQRYMVIDFDFIELFGIAEIVLRSGGKQYIVFQLLRGYDYNEPLESPALHIIRLFNEINSALAAYKALTV